MTTSSPEAGTDPPCQVAAVVQAPPVVVEVTVAAFKFVELKSPRILVKNITSAILEERKFLVFMPIKCMLSKLTFLTESC